MDTAIRCLKKMTLIIPFNSVYKMINNIDYATVCYHKHIFIYVFIYSHKLIKPNFYSIEEVVGTFSVRISFVHF